MKRFIPLLAVFAAGIAASFALASPPPGHGPNTSTSTSTSSGPGKSGTHGSKAKCRPLNLKGTVTGGTIALNVTKASGPRGKALVGTVANLSVNGKVSVQAWSCAAAGQTGPQTLVLRQLHAGGSPQAATTTTTTTTSSP
ncbi:MAG TPA: hypothetical protein VFU26_05120 [Gaiellaceae bacterium]|jgi:hypothetical protein|nr:hypothetical protein [Gaiellaceae bacterium]